MEFPASRKLPAGGIQSPLLQVLFQHLDGLGGDKRTIAHVIELSVVIRGQAGIGAYDELRVVKVFEDLLFQRDQGGLLIGVSLVDTKS